MNDRKCFTIQKVLTDTFYVNHFDYDFSTIYNCVKIMYFFLVRYFFE